MFRRKNGWYGESYRHYLAAKGYPTGSRRYWQEKDATAMVQPINVNVSVPKQKGKSGYSRGIAIDQGVGPDARKKAIMGDREVQEAAEEQERRDRESYRRLEEQRKEVKGVGAVYAGASPLDRLKSMERREPRIGDVEGPEWMRRLTTKRALPTAEEAAQITLLSEQVLERTRMTGQIPSSEERSQLSRTVEGKRVLRAIDAELKMQKEDARESTTLGDASRRFGNMAIEKLTQRDSEAYGELFARRELKDEQEAALMQRISPGLWGVNPIVQDTSKEPLLGAFDPFEIGQSASPGSVKHYDLETPISERMDQWMNGTNLWLNERSVDARGRPSAEKPTQAELTRQVDQLMMAKSEMAKVDAKPYEKGKKAFLEGNREKLVSSIVDLEKQEKAIRQKREIVRQLKADAVSESHRKEVLVKPKAGFFELPFTGGGARRLDQEIRNLEDVDAELRKSENAVAGRAWDLNNSYQRMRGVLPPQQSKPQKIVKVFEKTGDEGAVSNPVEFAEEFLEK
jgi:hypothetical protein